MPPKRTRPTATVPAAASAPVSTPVSASVPPADVKPVSEPPAKPVASVQASVVAAAAAPDPATPDPAVLPMCPYGINCYRKNPQHFKEYRHPSVVPSPLSPPPTKKTRTGRSSSSSKAASSSGGGDDTEEEKSDEEGKSSGLKRKRSSVAEIMAACGGDPDDDERKQKVEDYKKLLEMMLRNKRTISAEKKRVIREVRRENGITDAEHTALLGKFGWSEDEYEDGEKSTAADDVDLEEERTTLADPNGFSVIWLEKEKLEGATPAATKARKNVFGRVCMMFFQTMAKAQGNFTVKSVGVIANSRSRAKYAALKAEYAVDGKDGEQWGFHGTSVDAVQSIAKIGFLAPSGIKAVNRKRRCKKIQVLDSGYFGSGVYFSDFSDYAMYYSDTRESDQILLCQILPGRAFKCHKRMDGQQNVPGYDSHISPHGNEIVIFNPDACLPRYIIRFSQQDETEREQES